MQKLSGIAVVGALLALLGTPFSALAQAAQDPQPMVPPPIPPSMQGTIDLSLREAIALGIENNLDIEVSRHTPFIANEEHNAAWGAFDPNFSSQFTHTDAKTPSVNPFVGNAGGLLAGGAPPLTASTVAQRETGGQASLAGLLPKLGWQYDVTYTGKKTINNNTFLQPLQPEYDVSLFATGTLPILKGFLWGEPWVQVETSGIGTGIAFQQFRKSLMDVVRSIEASYWDLAARREDLAVAHKSQETSKALVRQTQAQYEVGVVSKVEVTEAEAGLADRDFSLITAKNRYRAAQDRFLDQVFGTYFTPTTTLTVNLKDKAENYRVFDVDEAEAAQKAFAHRPELEIAKDQTDQQKVLLKFAKNQRLPQLDLTGSYGWTGLSGEGFNRGSGDFSGNYAAAHNDFGFGNRRTFSAGVLFSVPIGNTAGRASVMKSKLELHRQTTQTHRLEQSIILEVRDAVRNLRSALEGIEAAKRGVDAAAEQLRAEQIRLEHGESTPFDVLLREQDRTSAETKLITAYQIYHDSVAALDRSQGTILRDRNVVVEQALPMR